MPLQVLLVHMGGPFWARKDEHAWSIPKGEYGPGTDTPLDDPRPSPPRSSPRNSAPRCRTDPSWSWVRSRRAARSVIAFARAADFDAASCGSNTFEVEWPPRSGRLQTFPEVDRAEWFDIDTARSKLVKGQVVISRPAAGRT